MAVGTLSIAVTPGYAQIGIHRAAHHRRRTAAAGSVRRRRSLGGVAIYLAEIATPGRRGFYCSWQAVSQQVAVVCAALFGFGLDGESCRRSR
mgnify:CR=1 FL=1